MISKIMIKISCYLNKPNVNILIGVIPITAVSVEVAETDPANLNNTPLPKLTQSGGDLNF
ncbi:hypothetical protein GCM10010099_06520 [Streptomyces cinereus]|nr:hypothetical protein GCM10010099_06520 [Streptomyces cinereus]